MHTLLLACDANVGKNEWTLSKHLQMLPVAWFRQNWMEHFSRDDSRWHTLCSENIPKKQRDHLDTVHWCIVYFAYVSGVSGNTAFTSASFPIIPQILIHSHVATRCATSEDHDTGHTRELSQKEIWREENFLFTNVGYVCYVHKRLSINRL